MTSAVKTPLAVEMDAELNGLANGAYSIASGVIENEAYTYMALELNLASLTPVAGQQVAIYLLPSLDGTNYEDGGGAVAPPNIAFLCAIDLRAATAAQRRVVTDLFVPPFNFKLVVQNVSIAGGVAFASSGNTLKYRLYTRQAV